MKENEFEMGLIKFLKQLSYQPSVSRLVWRLRLARIMRKLYYWLNRPPGDVIHVEVGGLTTSFYVRTPWELRSLESAGGLGHEQHILELLIPKVRPGDVVYDIGSNFGIYTILLAKAIGPSGIVIAVEPESQSYKHFQENLKLNALTNVRSFNLALGDYTSEAKLYVGEAAGASSLMRTHQGHGYQVVEINEGDWLVEREKLPLPRLVKIDVEGNEYAVIQGLRQTLKQPTCELVCCEIHPQLLPVEQKPEQILDVLRSLGFNRIDIYQRGTTEYHVLAQKEIVQ